MLSESKLIEAFTQVAVGFFHLLFNFVGRVVGEKKMRRKMDLIGYSSVDVKERTREKEREREDHLNERRCMKSQKEKEKSEKERERERERGNEEK